MWAKEVLAKYNPYHDEMGRFTGTGEGANAIYTVSAMGADGKGGGYGSGATAVNIMRHAMSTEAFQRLSPMQQGQYMGKMCAMYNQQLESFKQNGGTLSQPALMVSDTKSSPIGLGSGADKEVIAAGEKAQKEMLASADGVIKDYKVAKDAGQVAAIEAENRVALPAAQKGAVTKYTGSSYSAINAALRKGDLSTADPKMRNCIQNIDKAIDRSSLKENTCLIRNVPSSSPTAKALRTAVDSGDPVGAVISNKGYMSTSLRSVFKSNGGTELRLLMPKGSKALTVDHISANSGENEFILPRNSKFSVIKHEGGTMNRDVYYCVPYSGK